MEARIIAAALQSKEAWENVQRYIEEGDFSEKGRRILEEVALYYSRDHEATSADSEIILNRINRTLPSEKQAEQFRVAIGAMAEMEVSASNTSFEFLELKRDNAGTKLARAIQACLPREEVDEALAEFTKLSQATTLNSAPRVALDLEALFSGRLVEARRYKLLPGILNQAIGGGVTRGDSIVIFGRPNAGKSTFAINAANGFVKQGLRVVYIENEDSDVRTTKRIVRRLIERPQSWCEDNAEEATWRAAEAGIDRFYLHKLTPGTTQEVDAICNDLRPDVLIVNQIRGMAHGIAGKSLTAAMEKIAVLNRNIGQKYSMILCQVTQANANKKDNDGNVIDKPILYMEDIDSSLTGVPGAADFVFGIGTSRELKSMNRACISICKSKDDGDGEHFFVSVDPDIGKVISK